MRAGGRALKGATAWSAAPIGAWRRVAIGRPFRYQPHQRTADDRAGCSGTQRRTASAAASISTAASRMEVSLACQPERDRVHEIVQRVADRRGRLVDPCYKLIRNCVQKFASFRVGSSNPPQLVGPGAGRSSQRLPPVGTICSVQRRATNPLMASVTLIHRGNGLDFFELQHPTGVRLASDSLRRASEN